MIKQLNFLKNTRDLLLRYIMITAFMFMCIPLFSVKPEIMEPLFGVFYFVALIYYFWFTLKTEGSQDVNRVNTGTMPRFRWKGAVCALILAVPLIVINVVPNFFPNPVPEEYQAYFTGEKTALKEDDNFNVSLREISGKEGYISEITFTENGNREYLIYHTSNGNTVICNGLVKDQTKMYSIAAGETEDGTVEYRYFGDKELTDEQTDAFAECRNAVDDIDAVLGTYPNWQAGWNVVKMITTFALQPFCDIFARGNGIISSVVYGVSMLVLCAAAQVGYGMGYHNIEILRKKK